MWRPDRWNSKELALKLLRQNVDIYSKPDKLIEAGADAMQRGMFSWGELYCTHDNGGEAKKRWACPICRLELKETIWTST